MPEANSSWHGDFIREYHDVNINVAISVEDGLVSPVVRSVNNLGMFFFYSMYCSCTDISFLSLVHSVCVTFFFFSVGLTDISSSVQDLASKASENKLGSYMHYNLEIQINILQHIQKDFFSLLLQVLMIWRLGHLLSPTWACLV